MNKIKICGITNLKDALACINLEVDFIGFIFYKNSPRFISPKNAKNICDSIGSFNVKKVGVFVNEELNEINKIGKELGLDYVQLHGNETNEFINNVKFKTIKAFSIDNKLDKSYQDFNATYWLFDTFDKKLHGGTGKSFNWDLISDIPEKNKVILSGGLDSKNIIRAAEESNAHFFDVCSGVEKSPGTKDTIV